MLGAAVGASEECILAVHCNRTDRPLDGIGVDPDAAIVEETRKVIQPRERVADRFGELCLLADQPVVA